MPQTPQFSRPQLLHYPYAVRRKPFLHFVHFHSFSTNDKTIVAGSIDTLQFFIHIRRKQIQQAFETDVRNRVFRLLQNR